ncbi:MAG: tRNA dimethylallyltransferase [Bacteroidales bacterium]
MSVADKVLIFQELSEQAELYERINRRVDVMIENGFLEEAETLYEFRDRPALKTVGYKELFDYLDGKHSLDKAVELIKRNTRRYAKRQITWWRRS